MAGELSTFPGAVIDAVTGEIAPEERRERVEHYGDYGWRPCWSPPIAWSGKVPGSTQFTAVVHYDIALEPDPHRAALKVGLTGAAQARPDARKFMLYGQNNPMILALLKVIPVRQGDAIQKELGVLVPMFSTASASTVLMVKCGAYEAPHRQSTACSWLNLTNRAVAGPRCARYREDALERGTAPSFVNWRAPIKSSA